jgi:hypothetical protein
MEVLDNCDTDLFACWTSENSGDKRNEIWLEARAIKTFRRKLDVAIRDALGDKGEYRDTEQ